MKLKLLMAFAFAASVGCSSQEKKAEDTAASAPTETTTTTTTTKTTTTEGAATATDPHAGHTHAPGAPMDKEHMDAMMKECQDQGKDAKTCQSTFMTECQKTLNKAQCKKLMKQGTASAKKK